ncbi:MAG: hypothetical protein KF718_25970 [Polyangiaceae bacterium]|nr:hypothetical protein [Polyangiaceae bacterium]
MATTTTVVGGRTGFLATVCCFRPAMRISPSLIAVALLGATELALAADTWSTPHPGTRHLYRTTATPGRIRALEVDLCAAGVSLRATASGERQRTTSSFGSLVQARAARREERVHHARPPG